MTRIAVLGLGEAGRIFAEGLAASAEVVGFDPAWRGEPSGFSVAPSASAAVEQADVVLVLTSGRVAATVFDDVAAHVAKTAIYADMSSSSPTQKQQLAERAAQLGFAFADVTLMAPVPREQVRTPAQASGTGARTLSQLLNPLGLRIEPVGEIAGQAAARKLLRSIVVKGLTALLIESLRTAEELELLDWFSDHIDETLTTIDTAFIRRLIEGTAAHSDRRVHEMLAAAEMVKATGGQAFMTEATAKVLESVNQPIPRGNALR